MNAFDRPATVDLSGEWTFTTDPDDVGVAEDWYERDESLLDSRRVTVPHAWQEHDDLREYTGIAWYRRTVTLDEFDAGSVSGSGLSTIEQPSGSTASRSVRTRAGIFPSRST